MNTFTITRTIQRALQAAGLSTRSGPLRSVTTTIERALAAAGLASPRPRAPLPQPRVLRPRGGGGALPGQFLDRRHGSGLASRAYKLYVPSGLGSQPAPLIVMLHGCKQNAGDFATGTRMNEWAESEGFLVAYPEQTARDNGANCWNWFERAQQSADGVEPALIAGIVRDIGVAHTVDAARVFVAGLSAGAAMAVILGHTHPGVFAGVAAHSGLPMGAAHDVPSAFSAMAGRTVPKAQPGHRPAVPTIVFHGDADATVSPSNSSAIVEQALRGYDESQVPLRAAPREAEAEADAANATRTSYEDANGITRVESWLVRGGAHAWFGGSAEGSYTAPDGPDASAEIVRFFLAQTPRRH